MKIIIQSVRMSTFLVLISLLSYACQKEKIMPDTDPQNETLSTNKLSLENGVLVFFDQEHFDATLKVLDNHPEKSTEVFAAVPEFTALKSLIDQAMLDLDEGRRISVDLAQEDFFQYDEANELFDLVYPFYNRSALLSKDGVVKIGTKVIKYDKNFVYTIHDGDFTKLTNLSERTEEGFVDEVYTSKVISQQLEEGRNNVTEQCTKYSTVSGVQYSIRTSVVACTWVDGFVGHLTIDSYMKKTKQGISNYAFANARLKGNLTYVWGIEAPQTIAPYDFTASNNSAFHSLNLVDRIMFNGNPPTTVAISGSHTGYGYFRASFLDVISLNCTINY